MFCGKCGKELENNTQYCPFCGENVKLIDTTKKTEDSIFIPSLILGIIGICFSMLFALIGHICCIVGICIHPKKENYSNRNSYYVCIVGEVLSIISSILGFMIFASLNM